MVFMMDSWWNPSVEYQAMDRIHRLGQKRPVKVIKLVVEDSIEDQVSQIPHVVSCCRFSSSLSLNLHLSPRHSLLFHSFLPSPRTPSL
jgi:hypothetical protein